MNLDIYPYNRTENNQQYYFFSYGPKGRIIKLVTFTELTYYTNRIVYNLALTDYNEQTGQQIDNVLTNNNDLPLVLATVGYVVIDFCNRFPFAFIYAEGSEEVGIKRNRRTAAYTYCIARYWDDISNQFEVLGVKDDGSEESFKQYSVYKAILVTKK